MAARKKKTAKKAKPETPRLSPTIAEHLIEECPFDAWANHRLLGNCITLSEQQLSTRERGKALHNIVLEGGDKLEKIDYDAYRSDAAKALRVEARISGKIPVLVPKLAELEVCAERIAQELFKQGIPLLEGVAEEKILWEEESELGPVLCSGVLDWRSEDGLSWFDLKTTEGSVSPASCAATLMRSHGLIQDAAYTSALGRQFPGNVGRIKRLFIFAQSKEPFMVTPAYLSSPMQFGGESKWLRAVELWARCLKDDHWPQHTDGPIELQAPGWAVAMWKAEEEALDA